MRDVPPGARQGVEVKSDPDDEELEEGGEGDPVKEEEEERTGEELREGERVKTEKSEARDSIEERRKTEAGDEKEEVDEKKSIDGVKAELLDANNDSKPSLHLDPVQVVKAEVNNNDILNSLYFYTF